MAMDAARLASLVTSRVCHDLSGSISPATTAVDLLQDDSDPEMQAHAKILLEDSILQARRKLEFLRYAFGSMGTNESAADMREARAFTDAYLINKRVGLEWDIGDANLNFQQVKVLMQLAMVAFACLSIDGSVVLSVRPAAEAGRFDLAATARSRKAELRQPVADALNGQEPEHGWSGRNIQPYLASVLVGERGGTIDIRNEDDQIVFTATNM